VNIFKRLLTSKNEKMLHPQDCTVSVSDDISSHNNGMRFTIYNANGGKVVQFSQYDKIKDRHYSSLYIIRDEDDMGQELSQIILREQLSR
jgi:5S rRNA maturation endonuclease (ribonuclease M5)